MAYLCGFRAFGYSSTVTSLSCINLVVNFSDFLVIFSSIYILSKNIRNIYIATVTCNLKNFCG